MLCTDYISALDLAISNSMSLVYDELAGTKVWQCLHCTKSNKDKTAISRHVESHLEGHTHKCTICHKTYKTRLSLNVHMTQKHRKLFLNWTLPANAFLSEWINCDLFFCSELDMLINTSMVKDVGDAGLWRCLKCNLANRHKARIRTHVETHFQSQQICSLCNQVCKTRDSLRKHFAKMHRDNYCS